MTNDKFEKPLDDHSNAAMTHTSEGIATSDFVIRDLDINKEPEMKRESKNFWQDAWARLKRNKLLCNRDDWPYTYNNFSFSWSTNK